MKKLLATTALVAALAVGAQSAQAAPTLTLTFDNASATASECTGTFGLVTATSCTITSTTGTVGFTGDYGSFFGDILTGLGNGSDVHSKTQPALWLLSEVGTDSAGVFGLTLTASGYTAPLGAFPIQSTASGTVDQGMSVNVSDYFDASDSGVAGAGTLLSSFDWVGFASGSAPGSTTTSVTNPGDYSESWVATYTSTGNNGQTINAGVNGTLQEAVPSPTPLSLLGFGLVALAFITRRRGFQN